MNTSETDLELIERFISGKLSQTELEDFETRMEEDHEFARKLRLRKTFPSLFKAEGHDEIVMTPDSTPAEKPGKEKAHSSKNRYFVWGGIVLFLAMAVVYFLFIRTGPAHQEMTAEKSVVKTAVKTPAPKPAGEPGHPPMKTADQTVFNKKIRERQSKTIKRWLNRLTRE